MQVNSTVQMKIAFVLLQKPMRFRLVIMSISSRSVGTNIQKFKFPQSSIYVQSNKEERPTIRGLKKKTSF
jgi:hypothetical protein